MGAEVIHAAAGAPSWTGREDVRISQLLSAADASDERSGANVVGGVRIYQLEGDPRAPVKVACCKDARDRRVTNQVFHREVVRARCLESLGQISYVRASAH